MHIFFGTRGIKHEVEKFTNELSCQYLTYKHPKGNILQVRLSPIQLWDISFPMEHTDAMLTTLFGKGGGKTINNRHNKYAVVIRKIMGVQKIPKYKTNLWLPPKPDHIEMIGIGIKEDEFKDGVEKI